MLLSEALQLFCTESRSRGHHVGLRSQGDTCCGSEQQRCALRGIALLSWVTLPPGSPCDCKCAALGAGVVACSGAEAAEAAEEAAALLACLAVVPVVDGHLHVHSKP